MAQQGFSQVKYAIVSLRGGLDGASFSFDRHFNGTNKVFYYLRPSQENRPSHGFGVGKGGTKRVELRNDMIGRFVLFRPQMVVQSP